LIQAFFFFLPLPGVGGLSPFLGIDGAFLMPLLPPPAQDGAGLLQVGTGLQQVGTGLQQVTLTGGLLQRRRTGLQQRRTGLLHLFGPQQPSSSSS